MATREQLTFEAVQAIRDMTAEEGASASGDMPPSEYVHALRQCRHLGEAREVAAAHREQRVPDVDGVELNVPAKHERVDRARVGDSTKQAFRDARGDDDLQGQLDVLFGILTGEAP